MGNDVSKEIKDIVDVLEVNSKSCMTSGNLTKCAHIDPRSPSQGIMRTPIEVRKNLEQTEDSRCVLRRRWKSEPEITPAKKSLADKSSYLVLGDDPRSPTVGISRTPIQVPHGEGNCEKLHYGETMHDNVPPNMNMVVDVPDCRSPSSGICRTPIQVAASGEDDFVKDLQIEQPEIDIHVDNKLSTNITLPWYTPTSKRIASPSFVYTDEDNIVKGKKDVKEYEQNSVHEKENDVTLKRKLKFTPETVKTGVKVRTPLGSRCNFQDSPSQFLKKLQVQKVDEELGCAGENAISKHDVTKIIKKTQSVIEWDNTDSTLIV